jgi:hypothetical protein
MIKDDALAFARTTVLVYNKATYIFSPLLDIYTDFLINMATQRKKIHKFCCKFQQRIY